MNDKILYLYAKGMTTRDIVSTFDEMYGAEILPTLISRVTISYRLSYRVAVTPTRARLPYCL